MLCTIDFKTADVNEEKDSDKFPIIKETSDKLPTNKETSDKISDKLQKIVDYMQGNNGVVTQAEVANMFGVSDRQARNYLSLLINGRIIALEQTKIEQIH